MQSYLLFSSKPITNASHFFISTCITIAIVDNSAGKKTVIG